jgi:hypothetical protein
LSTLEKPSVLFILEKYVNNSKIGICRNCETISVKGLRLEVGCWKLEEKTSSKNLSICHVEQGRDISSVNFQRKLMI